MKFIDHYYWCNATTSKLQSGVNILRVYYYDVELDHKRYLVHRIDTLKDFITAVVVVTLERTDDMV